jgi:sulfatase maturation enzyme AslB (radical SAM superfamily)
MPETGAATGPKSDPSGSFCVLPWMHLFADERGAMHPCCRAVAASRSGSGAASTPRRIQDPGGIEAGWNSPEMRAIRLAMIEGRRPESCARCYLYEDVNVRSHRQSQNEKYSGLIPDLLARTGPDGSAPMDLLTVDLRLGNLCNLRCRMCSPQSSKGLIGEWASMYGAETSHPFFEELRQLNWFSGRPFWEVLDAATPHLERLHFAGGEPLLIPEMFDFLERLIESGRASKIHLSYNTNLTVLPPRIYDLWPQFRGVRVTVSLDGWGAVNSFIRHPSDWSTIDQNLRTLDTQADRLNCSGGLGLNTTVQLYNIFRLDELLEYTATVFERVEAPNLSLLSEPVHYSIQVLPPGLKERATARLQGFIEGFSGRWPERWRESELGRLISNVEGVLVHMAQADRQDAISSFLRWNGHQDRFRGQDVLTVIPELAPLFDQNEAASPVSSGKP